MLLAFSKSNDSPCFVKIAIFRQKKHRLLTVLFLYLHLHIFGNTVTAVCLKSKTNDDKIDAVNDNV